jgi:predicted Zn-dependent protease
MKLADQPLRFGLKEPVFILAKAQAFSHVNHFSNATKTLEEYLSGNPRNYDAALFLSQIYEFQGDFINAQRVRAQIMKYDPLNIKNRRMLDQDNSRIKSQ